MTQSKIQLDAASMSISNLLRCAGFTLLLIVNDLILREPAILIDGLGISGYDLPMIRIILNVGFVGVLLVVGIVSLARGREATQHNMFILQSISGLASLVILGLTALNIIPQTFEPALLCLSFLFLGLFASFGLLYWISLFSKVDPHAAWIEIVTALFVSSLGYVFALYAAAPFPTALIFGFFCISSLAANGFANTQDDGMEIERIECNVASFRKHLPTVLCIAALNYVLTASRMSLTELSSEAINMICACGICLAAILLFISSFVVRKDVEIGLLYRVAFPVIALVFLLLPYADVILRGLFMLLGTSLGTMGTTVLILIALQARKTCELTTTGSYGVCSGIVHIALTIGLIVSPDAESPLAQSSIAALIIVYVLLLIFLISQRAGKQESKKQSVPSHISSDPNLACTRFGEKNGLTQRETEILCELVLGRSSGEIARSLGISAGTVKTHIKNIYRKLEIHTKGELLALVSEDSTLP